MEWRTMGAALGLTLALTQGASADVIDQKQDQTGFTMALIGGGGTQPVAQTVRCDIDGFLTSVSLPLYTLTGSGWLTVEIREHAGYPSDPDGKTRAKIGLGASSLPLWFSNTWTNIPVTPPIAVSDGMEYSIVVRASSDVVWPLGPDWLDVYPDGDAWGTDSWGDWFLWPEWGRGEDFAFMTWMDPTRTTMADVQAAILNLHGSILAVPASRIAGGVPARQQLADSCSDALESIEEGQLGQARSYLQFILDRSDERWPIADWFLNSSDAGPIWREAMDAWSMVGFLD